MKDVYLYGAGSFGRLMFGIFKQSQKANVVGFIDRAARDGQTLFGLSVLPLDDMRIPPDANVLICITLASEDYGDLYHSLQSRNPDWSITNGQSIMADRVKYDRDNYSGDMDSPNVKNRIQQARRLLCDEHSETVFDSNLNAHKNRDYSGCFSSCGC
ncbi:MAG: hypothetical protein LBD92_06250, partial [Oscillospiraceae bacterium]|nr:hypothetical protein [Oscillospiraceae bacterium]